jgi:hypothetical protein
MASYSAYLGRRVEVHYRAGDIFLPATGILAADSGKSIFLEEHSVQRGREKHFRWEIPYAYILKIEEKPVQPEPASSSALRANPGKAAGQVPAADAKSGSGPLLPLRNRTEQA